jgi:hypothetical protein
MAGRTGSTLRTTVVGMGLVLAFAGCGRGASGADASSGKVDAETASRLQALGYVEWVEGKDDLSQVGVVKHDPRAARGLTFYKSRPAPEAHLIDLDGRVIHTWRQPRLEITDWESFLAFFYPRGGTVCWDHIELLPDGAVLGIVKYRDLEKVDWNSKLLWRTPIPAHHDLDVAPDGRILTLTQRMGTLSTAEGPLAIVDNGIAILSPEGKLLREISLASLFGQRVPRKRIDAIRAAERRGKRSANAMLKLQDVFHSNAIEVLRRDTPSLGTAGQVLISVRELDLVAVVDLDREQVVWEWGPGELQRQHHPSILPNGHIVVFDNGIFRRYSRIVEMDPVTRKVVWEYHASPPQSFFSRRRGGVEWLPGDHFLVTYSSRGRAFEIDRQGHVLWEFLNPDIDPFERQRGAIYRVDRLTPARVATLPLGQRVAPEVTARATSASVAP